MNNMKRMVWIAVAMLIMIGIMGFGLHTLNRITEVNKERREKDKGEAFVAKFWKQPQLPVYGINSVQNKMLNQANNQRIRQPKTQIRKIPPNWTKTVTVVLQNEDSPKMQMLQL